MSIILNDNLAINAPKSIRTTDIVGVGQVYTTKENIPANLRFIGLETFDGTNKWILKDGILDEHWTNQSIIATYVPYTGATANVNLGANNLQVRGDGKSVYVISADNETGVALMAIDIDGTPYFALRKNESSNGVEIRADLIDDQYIQQLQPKSGTIALLSDITGTNSGTNTGDQDLSGLVPYTGASANVDLGDYTIDTKRILQSNNGGSIFIGEGAGLNDDLSNNYNVAIGHQSLYTNTSGKYNTAIGLFSMKLNVNGDRNVSVGYQSLFSNTSGYDNTALGHNSLLGNTTGYDNTSIGVYSLSRNTLGNYNSSIGYKSGDNIADGATGRTTGDYGLYLGAYAKASDNGTTNEIAIGANVIANGSNTATILDDNGTDVYMGENAQANVRAKDIISSGVILSTGTTGTTPVSGSGTRLMWIPEKASLRAGSVGGDAWDAANIGSNSIAFGQSTKASGDNSTAIGSRTTANGYNSTAIGVGTKAESYATTAIGRYNVGGGTADSWVSTDPIFEIGIGTGNEARANAMTVLKNGDVYANYGLHILGSLYDSNGDVGTSGQVLSSTETGTEWITTSQISVTHAELVALIAADELIPGTAYRITDFVTTTAQDNTSSAGHAFDIIVTALTANTVSENASAAIHEGDTYFTGKAKLEAWEIKYTPYNDADKYIWADTVSGKGVIYYMKDEWDNELHYDFKNIMFPRTAGGIVPQTDDYYTFSWVNEDDEVEDLSLIGNSLKNDEEFYPGMFSNKIGVTSSYIYPSLAAIESLPNNVIIDSYANNDGLFFGVYSNKIGCNSYSNTIGNNLNYNTIGNNFSFNTIGGDFRSNAIGDEFYLNIIGDNFSLNTIENCFNYNTVENDFFYNNIGNGCNHSTFGNGFNYNVVHPILNKNLNSITELYSKSYPHELISTNGGKVLIRWYDSSGVMQTQLVP